MHARLFLPFAAWSFLAPAALAQGVRLDVTRDAWVSEVGREADGNNGAAPRLKLKSMQEMTLLDVDPRPLLGRVIRSATLHLKTSSPERLWRVTVSGVGAEWFEGQGSGYAIEPGGATFRSRRHPDLPWSPGGGDLCGVVLGNGGTIWRMADATAPDAGGWQSVAVDPRVLAARVAGLSYGFLAFDDTGTEWTRDGEQYTRRGFPNRFVYSREQNRASAPYFTVDLSVSDHAPPAAPGDLHALKAETALLPGGEALVAWTTPADRGPAGVLGFIATLDGEPIPRALIPLAGARGERVVMHLRHRKSTPDKTVALAVRAVDAAGNIGPAATTKFPLSARTLARLAHAPETSPDAVSRAWPRLGDLEIAVVDELDKIDPRSGAIIPAQAPEYFQANHLYQAGRIALHAARGEAVAFQVVLHGPRGRAVRPRLTLDLPAGKPIAVELGRHENVRAANGPLPDPVVPWNSTQAHASESALPYTSLHIELQIPHGLAPGTYHGKLALSHAGVSDLEIPVELEVWDFDLPDRLSFLPEMNCYDLPADHERDYYRLAHRHRTVLNRVPYSQSGKVADGCAPAWDPERQTLDWKAWDRRFGPYFSGAAFAGLPREGVPLEVFYLPLFEGWPTPMEGNYNENYWADKAFPRSYEKAFTAAARGMAEHFQNRGWNQTLFEGFLNNKSNFKERGWSRGSSPWVLDEPADFTDYWALRTFARWFHAGVREAALKPDGARMVFRADISRPQWRRDALDGLLDVMVVSSAFRQYPELVLDRKRTLGEIVFEYGSTNAVEGSNYQPVGWCLDVFSRGADGVIPWQTVGNDESWKNADTLSLFYPARPSDRGQGSTGPIPSIRLKAYRRGQQDVEYLALWASRKGEPRWALEGIVRTALKSAGAREATGFAGGEDAGRIDYQALGPRDLHALRLAIGQELTKRHPPPVNRLVDFRTPPRDPARARPGLVGE